MIGTIGTLAWTPDICNDIIDRGLAYTALTDRVFMTRTCQDGPSRLLEFDGTTFQQLREYTFNYEIGPPRVSQDGLWAP